MMASGTISGPVAGSYGSMLEIAWKGTKPVPMKDGSERKFILDGDTIAMEAVSVGKQYNIGFGSCKGLILASV
jgi:fumarylacetoacetase